MFLNDLKSNETREGKDEELMRMLSRWYYENRDKIWITVIVIGFILLFVNILNNYYENKAQLPITSNTTNVSAKETINNEIEGELESSASLTTGEGVDGKKLSKHINVIDKFFTNCSNGKIDEAYALLTDECKETNFPTLDVFKTKYYEKVFSGPKTYSVQNWSGNTYKVMIIDDPLKTGKVTSSEAYLQDYMTIPNSDIEKLNINRYIGRTTKEKITSTNELEITYIKKETYMDYEEYTISVKNLTNKDITLDKGTSTKNIYLLDDNNVKQYVNTGEINYNNLLLKPGATKEYTFRFSNAYSRTRIMELLIFEEVIISETENSETTRLVINL